MLNYIWSAMMIISIISAAITGRMQQLSSAVLSGATDAINLVISILGMMCLWTGIMKIAQASGITSVVAKLFSPIIKWLFPGCDTQSDAAKAICLNLTANMLGLGNAATPFGIKAMQELQKNNIHPNIATNSMAMFVIMNTASLQIIPTFLCALRHKYESPNPMGVLPIIWITSIISLVFGVACAKCCEKFKRYQP